MDEKIEDYSTEDVAFLAHHKVDTLIEVLLAKKLISEDEMREKSEELFKEDEETDEEEV